MRWVSLNGKGGASGTGTSHGLDTREGLTSAVFESRPWNRYPPLGRGIPKYSALPGEEHHETSPPKISASGRGRCRAAGVVARLNDFAPVSPLATNPEVIFARKALANDLNELIAWLKANPNKASAGFGASGAHLAAALFRKETGTQFTLVPYRKVRIL